MALYSVCRYPHGISRTKSANTYRSGRCHRHCRVSTCQRPTSRSAAGIISIRTCTNIRADAAAEGGSQPHAQAEKRKPVWARGIKYGQPIRKEDGDKGYYVDAGGELVEVMFHDYGFRSGHGRLYMEGYGKIPKGGFTLALENFRHEYRSLRRSFRFDEWREYSENAPTDQPLIKAWRHFAETVVLRFADIDRWLEARGILSKLTASQTDLELVGIARGGEQDEQMRGKLQQLQLSARAVALREKRREAAGGGIKTPWFVKIPYNVLCWVLDVIFPNRPIQRFWFLESVARMPYFSYISMLHLYESLGWWRAGADLRKVHFAEEWNELHHLQIMESLGGDELWVDRFFAQHASFLYYWILLLFFWVDPELAYNFSELIEAHAVDTYGEFADANEEVLKSMPPPLVALQYYKGDDLYMFDEFQTTRRLEPRRPPCRNLHDVFINIRDDEGEHVKTMRACQDGDIFEDLKNQRHTPP